MQLRKVLPVLLVAVAVSSCGGKGSYVRTSLGEGHVAPPVHVSDKGRKGGPDADLELMEAQRYLTSGDLPAAKGIVEKVLKRNPNSAEAHTFMAVILESDHDATGSGKHYQRAAELAPDNGATLGNYGAWLCAQGRAAEALSWFDRALAVPGYNRQAMVLANAGICAGKAGQQELADHDLRHAIELDPTNAAALGALAEREFLAGNAFEARAFSERRLAAAPADRQALLLASQIEQKLGDSAAAARYVARLNAEFPDASDARNSTTGDGGRK